MSLSLSLMGVHLLSRLLTSKIFSSARFIVSAISTCFSNRSRVVAVILAQSNCRLMSFTGEFFWRSCKILTFISSNSLHGLPVADSSGFLTAHIAIARAGNSESKTYPNSGTTVPALPTFITDKLDSNRVFTFSRRRYHLVYSFSSASSFSDLICARKILQTKTLRGMSPLTVSISSIRR
jgi:hypothetical protein